MCGRIVLISPVQALMRKFQLADGPDWQPGYNISPGRDIPAVVPAEGRLQLQLMHWGMAPPWAGPERPARELINARSETVGEKTVFSESFIQRRCLVPVDGFFEWQRRPGRNQPYLFRPAGGGLMALAGIWSQRRLAGGGLAKTCVILTTTANGTMLPVHDRMPVILPDDSWPLWLKASAAESQLKNLLQPVQDTFLASHPVTRRVGRPGFDGPECLEPIEPADPEQGDLFG